MFKTMVAGLALALAGSGAASASSFQVSPDPQARLILVSGGCGLAFHRNPFGACVSNRAFYVGGPALIRLPPPCPRFYHRDTDPTRPLCYPNF